MSPLLRDELRIVLCPDRVQLVRISRALTRRGLARQVMARHSLACDAGAAGEVPWASAIGRLSEALPGLAAGRVRATAIVSNHFMRYTMVPWSDTLTEAAEQAAYARHCFRTNYGVALETWDLCLSAGRPGLPRLASAIDSRLLEALRATFRRSGTPLGSIQPHLMAAYNQCRTALRKGPGWFVLHEPGSLCIALVDNAGCSLVRTQRVGADWFDQLPSLLEREACLAGVEAGAGTVYLCSPAFGAAAAPSFSGFEVRNLMSTLPASCIPDSMQAFSAAVQP